MINPRALASTVLMTLLLLPALGSGTGTAPESAQKVSPLDEQRLEMVRNQIERRGVRDPRVLEAMRTVPRHRFVPEDLRSSAYGDFPLPIGWEQTISQPYIVALMTELIEAEGDEKVLEIGTGSGYHAAVLSRVVGEVYSIEIVEPLGEKARAVLADLGYDNVHVQVGDGFRGWPSEAPFDVVILTAAPPVIPKPLLAQLKLGGRMILPLGKGAQELMVVTRTVDGFDRRRVAAVRFVPMTGEVQRALQP